MKVLCKLLISSSRKFLVVTLLLASNVSFADSTTIQFCDSDDPNYTKWENIPASRMEIYNKGIQLNEILSKLTGMNAQKKSELAAAIAGRMNSIKCFELSPLVYEDIYLEIIEQGENIILETQTQIDRIRESVQALNRLKYTEDFR